MVQTNESSTTLLANLWISSEVDAGSKKMQMAKHVLMKKISPSYLLPGYSYSAANIPEWFNVNQVALKELRHCSCILKKLAKFFKIISNPFQSSPSLAILVPFYSRITPLVFFFLGKRLFLGFAAL